MFSRRALLLHHLRANLFPPLPTSFVKPAEQAIDLVDAGDFRAEVSLPGVGTITALECVEAFRLENFLHRFDE